MVERPPSWVQWLPPLVILLVIAAMSLPRGVAHRGDIVTLLVATLGVVAAAAMGGRLAARLGQPAVLGELVGGIVLGNLGLAGFHQFEPGLAAPPLEWVAQAGVLLLLFSVGLESDFAAMMQVGGSALAVATLGVIAPMALGMVCTAWLFPGAPGFVDLFVGATLCATSVGITARVLADLGRTGSVEGRVILGAAVIDDVLGLLVLAVVAGVIRAADAGRGFEWSAVFVIVEKATLFLGGAILLGRRLSRPLLGWARRAGNAALLLVVALAMCFGLAWLAHLAGLAPIVGAFAAGLVLDDLHDRVDAASSGPRGLHAMLKPLVAVLAPVFFVLMGTRVVLTEFATPGVPLFAAVLTLAAVAGKQACALGVLEPGADRLAVGLGMIPRGEVGLIFASMGAAMTLHGVAVIDSAAYAAIIVMVALTTLMTPPLLAWRLRRQRP